MLHMQSNCQEPPGCTLSVYVSLSCQDVSVTEILFEKTILDEPTTGICCSVSHFPDILSLDRHFFGLSGYDFICRSAVPSVCMLSCSRAWYINEVPVGSIQERACRAAFVLQ